MDFTRLSTDIILYIVKQFLEIEDEENFSLVCTSWRDLREDPAMWTGTKLGQYFDKDGKMSRRPFRFFGIRTSGTEGQCCKVLFRGDRSIYAMKKARVYPKAEGVPYYMLREIEFLRALNHRNVAKLKAVALSGSELFMFFPYAPRTLHEALNSPNEPTESGNPLPLHVTKRFLYQILKGVSACHERGVLHRNIKPKHLLLYDSVDENSSLYPRSMYWTKDPPINPKDLETCTVCLSDFALVRTSLQPLRRFTPEVVTLWYRAPEVLLGGQYFTSVDMWAVGCVFAEMLCGKPFFAGVCEINQLFEIFSKLGSPTEESWPGFAELPNVTFPFPNWPRVGLKRWFPDIEAEALDLLERILEPDPAKRISAREALSHPYFDEEFLMKEHGTTHMEQEEEGEKDISYKIFAPIQELDRSTPNIPQRIGLADPKLLSRYLPNILKVESVSFQNCFKGKPYHLPQTFVQADRLRAVKRLVEVVDSFDMSIRTEFLAISFMDRFLVKDPTYLSQYQLLGTTCLHIASKCEDVSYIGVADLIQLSGGQFDDTPCLATELLELQEKVLNVLEFHLAIPTVLDFLHGFVFTLNLDLQPNFQEFFISCSYLAELSLFDAEFISMLPSQIAAGIVVYASLYFERLSEAQLDKLLRLQCETNVDAFLQAYRTIARVHETRSNISIVVFDMRYTGKVGNLMHNSVDSEGYLNSRWSTLVGKELPFGETSFAL